jgi:hypothetical protein
MGKSWFTRALSVFCAASGALTVSLPSQATTLYQSVPDFYVNDLPSGLCSSCLGSYRIFDTFTLAEPVSVQATTVALYGYPFPVEVNFSVWTVTSGNLPGLQLFQQDFTADLSNSVVVGDRAVTTFNVTGLTLDAGTYDVSYYNPSSLGLKEFYSSVGVLYQQNAFPGFISGAAIGFELDGEPLAIPLPATWSLFGPAIAAAFLLNRWSRRCFI